MAQYIPKDAVVAEIDRRIKILQNNSYENHKTICHLDSLKQSLDTLEVKEVDLEKEIDKWWWGRTWQTYGMMLNSCNIRDFAKHFFELGMAVSKK